jgi:hypothetical protein
MSVRNRLPAEIAALLEEALAWLLPWTQEQENRVLAIGPARRRIYSRVNEEQMKKFLSDRRCVARVWTAQSKAQQSSRQDREKHYYAESPNRGRFIDLFLIRFDDGAETCLYPSQIGIENV